MFRVFLPIYSDDQGKSEIDFIDLKIDFIDLKIDFIDFKIDFIDPKSQL